MKKNSLTLFITSWHETPGTGGMYTCYLDSTGKPEIKSFTPLTCAGYLAFDRDREILYSTCRVDQSTDGVAAFTVSKDGTLIPHGSVVASGGKSSCHLSVSANRKFLYCSNYFSASFSEFSLDDNGMIAERTRIIRHSGSGPNKERQEQAHPHCCVFTPDGKFMATADLGNDTVSCYPFDEKYGIDEKNPVVNKMTPGSGPRHLLFDPERPLCYLLNELGNTVVSCRFENGKLEKIDELLLLPRGANNPTKASAVRFSAAKDFLACSNRGFDSVALVKLDDCGNLTPAFLTLTGGSSPRDINFLGEDFFAAANEFSDEIRFFDFDASNGILSPNGYRIDLPRPLCIIPHLPLAKKVS